MGDGRGRGGGGAGGKLGGTGEGEDEIMEQLQEVQASYEIPTQSRTLGKRES